MAIVKTDDRHYKAIAEKIRDIRLTTESYTPSEMPSGIDAVYATGKSEGIIEGNAKGIAEGKAEGIAEGKQAEYDRFWNDFQEYGNKVTYTFAFAGYNWTDNIYNPKYPIKIHGNRSGNYAFQYSYITDTKVPITITGDALLPYAFAYMPNCHTIRKITVDETVTVATTTFVGLTALENIEFGGVIAKGAPSFVPSTKLTKASITSIINALSDTTSGLELGLSLTAVNNAFKTEEQPLGALTDEWKALVATKSNWTIFVA